MTKKNSSTTRKTTSTKRVSAKKGTQLSKKRFFLVSSGVYIIAVVSVVVIGLLTASVVINQQRSQRLERINDIYASLNLGDEYTLQSSDVFGDKRVYDGDKGRTYSSAKTYIHGDTVNATVTELDAKIKAAGFAFFGEPYPGSADVQYHYRSDDGEYVRLTVVSKPYWDAVLNASAMGKDTSKDVLKMDTNAGPAQVVIKVNLDDNNE